MGDRSVISLAVPAYPRTPPLTGDQLRKIGKQLATERNRQGWTQSVASEMAFGPNAVGRNLWGKWETGVTGPTRENARMIDAAFAGAAQDFVPGTLLRAWWPDDPVPPAVSLTAFDDIRSATTTDGEAMGAYRLEGAWAGVWVYLDEDGEPVGFRDEVTLTQQGAEAVGHVKSQRLFGSFRSPTAEYRVTFKIVDLGMALGIWDTDMPTSSFMGVMLGYVRDDSRTLEVHWLGNYNGGVRDGRLRWFLQDELTATAQRLTSSKVATREAKALVGLLTKEGDDAHNPGS